MEREPPRHSVPRERHVASLEGDARREPCFFCHRLPSPLRSGPTVLHRLSLVWPQVRPRDPPPWDTVTSCCAPFLLCIFRRRSRVSEGGDGGGLPSAASAPPVRRPAGLAGPSVLQVRSHSPGDPSITSDLFTPVVSSTLSMSAVVCRSVRFYELRISRLP